MVRLAGCLGSKVLITVSLAAKCLVGHTHSANQNHPRDNHVSTAFPIPKRTSGRKLIKGARFPLKFWLAPILFKDDKRLSTQFIVARHRRRHKNPFPISADGQPCRSNVVHIQSYKSTPLDILHKSQSIQRTIHHCNPSPEKVLITGRTNHYSNNISQYLRPRRLLIACLRSLRLRLENGNNNACSTQSSRNSHLNSAKR